MAERKVTVLRESGLHARPAALIVEAVQKLDASVTLTAGSKSATVRGIFDVLKLGAVHGAEVTISAEGPQADVAVDAIAAILQQE